MITMRLFHDKKPVFQVAIPKPEIDLQLKTAVKMLITRARTNPILPFRGVVADIDVELITRPRLKIVEPETVVPDGATIMVFAYSQKRKPVEVWEIN